MKMFIRLLVSFLALACLLSLARLAYVRLSSAAPAAPSQDSRASVPRATELVYAITSAGTTVVYQYDVKTNAATVSVGYEGPGAFRFNQGTNLCDQAYAIATLATDCVLDAKRILTVTVSDESKNGALVGTYSLDPKELGLKASDGYLTPVAVAADKSAIYLARRVEAESYVSGLWKLNLATGKISEFVYPRQHNVYEYDINPDTRQALGIAFTPPEHVGADATGPSSVYLMDLTAGDAFVMAGADLDGSKAVYENPILSPDGTAMSYHVVGGDTAVATTDAVHTPLATIHGIVKDWFDDTIVFDRDGNLFLYDLSSKTETQLTHETDATVEYLGVAR